MTLRRKERHTLNITASHTVSIETHVISFHSSHFSRGPRIESATTEIIFQYPGDDRIIYRRPDINQLNINWNFLDTVSVD